MLSEQELQKARQLKNEGYIQSEIEAYLGGSRIGIDSSIHQEQKKRIDTKTELNKKWFESSIAKTIAKPADFLVPGAVDVFGRSLARAGIGTDVDTSVTQEFVQEPTRREKVGAVLQTAGLAADVGITVGSLGAAAPLTLARNTAISGGLGYVYDVGEDLIAMENIAEVLDPDAGTLIGLTAPSVFAAAGAGFRALRPAQEAVEVVADDVGRAVSPGVREAAGETLETVADDVTIQVPERLRGAGQQAREIAQRVPRAIERGKTALDDAAERATLRQTGTPNIVGAIDNGIPAKTVNRVTNAPEAQQGAYRRIVQAASGDDPRAAEIVPGEYVTQMYRRVANRQQTVGQQLGEARLALGNEPLNFAPNRRTLVQAFKEDGIDLMADGSVNVSRAMDDKEQAALRSIWKELSKYNLDNITPVQINEIDQFLSRMQRNTTRADNLDAVYINVVDAQTGKKKAENAFNYLRNAFDEKLLDPTVDKTGRISELKSQYAFYKNITSAIEDNWFKGIDVQTSSDFDLAETAANALRRPDSRAVSRTSYRQMYNRLDLAARAPEVGYTGPNALDASNFYLKEVEPIFRETTPPASATSIFGRLQDRIMDVFDAGSVGLEDKQKGMRILLELDEAAIEAAEEAAG